MPGKADFIKAIFILIKPLVLKKTFFFLSYFYTFKTFIFLGVHMKKRLVAISCAAMIFSGCYGSNALFNKVHKFNGTIGDKWINSVVHFFAAICQVYSVSLLLDFIAFNTYEFWAGSSLFASNGTYFEKDAEGNSVTAMKNTDGSLSVLITDAQGNKADFVLQRDADIVRALDKQGNVVAQYNTAQ